MATALIALKDVSIIRKRLDTLVHAINHITLDIRQGEWLGIIGRNGSGKSTLARVLSGLSRVSEGEVIHSSDSVIRMVLQNPDAQIVGQTVFEDLAFGMENVCIPAEEMQSRATDALHHAGLNVPFDTPIEHLSGGQKQLLCVAAALVTSPDCIIFDESTAMLDPLSRHRLLETVSTLHRSGLTVIWITQWSEELTFATNVLALDEGQRSFYGSPRSFFYEVCGSLGYPPPYPVQVAIALSGRGVELTDRPITPEELRTALQALHPASEGAIVP